MRITDATLLAWLASNNVAHRTDLYTFTLLDGTVYRWTSWEYDLTIGGHLFSSAGVNAPLITRGPYKQSARLAIDTLDLTLVGGDFKPGSKTLVLNAIQGFFAGASVTVDHLIMKSPGDTSLVPISGFFVGQVAQVEPTGVAIALRLKSALQSLNVMLPKFPLRPQCGHAVYDANCGLVRASFTDTGSASGTLSTTQVQSTTAGLIARPNNYYNLGVLKFTSGGQSGLRRAVKAFSVSGGVATFTLALPLPGAPVAADAFSVYPGCNRSEAQCSNNNTAVGPAFNNAAQFRGYEHIPTPDVGTA